MVREGLNVGDTIVVNGLQHVRPGMTITPQRIAMGEEHLKDTPARSGLRGTERALKRARP